MTRCGRKVKKRRREGPSLTADERKWFEVDAAPLLRRLRLNGDV